MNKKYFFAIVPIVLIVAIAGWFYLHTQQPPSNASHRLPQASSSPLSEARVTITKDGFVPETISIKKGQQVRWVNKDKAIHRIASDPYPLNNQLPALDSKEPLAQNASYSFIFEKGGTFTYHDNLNPLKFKGTVIVK